MQDAEPAPASVTRVRGRARVRLGGPAYDVYLLQVDGGFAYLANDDGGTLVIRSVVTGEALDSPDLALRAREAIERARGGG
jgi:hypothetical protein